MRFWAMKSSLAASMLAIFVVTASTSVSLTTVYAASDDRQAAQAANDILATLQAQPGNQGDLEQGGSRRVCLRLGGDAIHDEVAWPMSAVIASKFPQRILFFPDLVSAFCVWVPRPSILANEKINV